MVVRLLRDSWRAWRKSPALGLASVCTLALGLGATTTFYALVDHLLLQPLPVPQPHQLVRLATEEEPQGADVSFPVWEQLQGRIELVDSAFAHTPLRVNLAPRGEVDFAQAELASGSVFRTLRVAPLLGRVIDERDDVADGGPDGWVAVLTHASWQRRFGGDADIIGRRIDVERVPVTIVGVLPPGFRGLAAGTAVDLVLPLHAETRVRAFSLIADGRRPFLSVVMRLTPAVPREALTVALRAAQPTIREATLHTIRRDEDREAYLRSPFLVRLAPDGGSGVASYGRGAAVLLALGGLLLMACCGNVATVLLAHGARRQPELAVRLSLGASRWEPVRQLVADALLLSTAGVLVAVVLTVWTGPWLLAQWHYPLLDGALSPARNWRVWGFASGVGILTGLACAAAAARRAMGSEAADVLRAGAGRHTTAEHPQHRVIVLQLAFSTLVLVLSVLLVRSYAGVTLSPVLTRLAPLVIAELRLAQTAVAPEAREAAVERAREAVEAAMPGATTSVAMTVPFYGGAFFWAIQAPDGAPSPLHDRLIVMDAVTPGHFETLGLRLLAGRSFDGRETRGSPLVGVVNRAFAYRFLGGETRVPQRVFMDAGGAEPRQVEIVGVVEDVPYENVTAEPHALLYLSRAQEVPNDRHAFLLVRSGPGRTASAAAVRAAIASHAPELSFALASLPQAARDQFERARVLALVAGFFAGLSVLIAAVGVFGVTSHAVTTRRREMGIRLAVGALPRQVRALVLGRALRTTLLGTTGGLLVAWWSTRLVAALLVKTDAHDPRVFGAVGVLLVALGVLSAWWPARHAARLDPVAVLRTE